MKNFKTKDSLKGGTIPTVLNVENINNQFHVKKVLNQSAFRYASNQKYKDKNKNTYENLPESSEIDGEMDVTETGLVKSVTIRSYDGVTCEEIEYIDPYGLEKPSYIYSCNTDI